jgi:hypothetical protein
MKSDGVIASGTRNASIKHCITAQFHEKIKTALRADDCESYNLE